MPWLFMKRPGAAPNGGQSGYSRAAAIRRKSRRAGGKEEHDPCSKGRYSYPGYGKKLGKRGRPRLRGRCDRSRTRRDTERGARGTSGHRLCTRRLAEQLSESLADDAEAFTGRPLEPVAIEH